MNLKKIAIDVALYKSKISGNMGNEYIGEQYTEYKKKIKDDKMSVLNELKNYYKVDKDIFLRDLINRVITINC